jgi:hypothetical protein
VGIAIDLPTPATEMRDGSSSRLDALYQEARSSRPAISRTQAASPPIARTPSTAAATS